MKFTFFHNNINVLDLDKSVEFYKKALGLEVTKEFHAPDGSFKLVYLGDGITPQSHELIWLREVDRRYDLEDSESCLVYNFFFQAEDGIRDFCLSRGLGDVV